MVHLLVLGDARRADVASYHRRRRLWQSHGMDSAPVWFRSRNWHRDSWQRLVYRLHVDGHRARFSRFGVDRSSSLWQSRGGDYRSGPGGDGSMSTRQLSAKPELGNTGMVTLIGLGCLVTSGGKLSIGMSAHCHPLSGRGDSSCRQPQLAEVW